MINNLSVQETLSCLATTEPMEVKMFITSNPAEAEKEMNDWLQQNSVQIHHIGQSQSEKNGRFVFIISLFYQRA